MKLRVREVFSSMVNLIDEGYSAAQIGKILPICDSTVRKWTRLWGDGELQEKLLENGKTAQGHKPLNLNKEVLCDLIFKEKQSSNEIAEYFKVSTPTIFKYAEKWFGKEALEILMASGRIKKRLSRYKDGRASYRKFKKDYCQECGIKNVRLEAHHIFPAKYGNDGQTLIKGDHSPENIKTLCNSCHQKIHYRELGRTLGPKQDEKTGRFLHV